MLGADFDPKNVCGLERRLRGLAVMAALPEALDSLTQAVLFQRT